MKTTPLNRAVQAIAASALLSFGSAGWAASTWNVSGCTGTSNVMGNSFSCTSTGDSATAATATAWGTNGSTSSATFAAAALAKYTNGSVGEFGVKNATEGLSATDPQHAMDNNLQTDLISLNFGTASVALNSLSLSYVSTDSDLSVLRFDATKGFTASISGKTIAQLLSTGWELVKNTSGGSTTATYGFNNTAGSIVSSSWWLISAYNAGYGGGSSASGNDYVKLMSVAGSVQTPPGKVPEPGSLALIGLGLLGLIGTSRRKAKSQSGDLAA
nr:exosortase-dependent surface protein XDP1 [uncultured Albidiferax sp.]